MILNRRFFQLAAGLYASSALLFNGATAAPNGASLQAVDIVDANGFGQPITAAIVQVPAGWQTGGGVAWDRSTHCGSNHLRVGWRAESPDRRQAFEILPGYNWQLQGTQLPTNPCPVQPLDSARAFLQAVVQQHRPGARILQYRDRPDIAEASAQHASTDPRMRSHHDAGDLLVAYQAGGIDFREVWSAKLRFTQIGNNVMGGTSMVFATRAPQGQLDFAEADRMAASITPNPHWIAMALESTTAAQRRFSKRQRDDIDRWHAGEMARIHAEGVADRAAIQADLNREVSRIQSQTHANTSASSDRAHRRELETIGEYGTFRDSSGTQVRSSIHNGPRVLRNPNGSYVGTDDPFYQPAGSEELRQVR